MYRFVVLDCARTEPAVLEAIDAATQIVVVANQELPTLRSAARIVSHLRQRCGPDRVKVAMTRFDPKADIGQRRHREGARRRGQLPVPNDYQTSVGAIARGEPLIVGNHSQLASSSATSRGSLAASRPPKKDAAKSGMFGRLGGRR